MDHHLLRLCRTCKCQCSRGVPARGRQRNAGGCGHCECGEECEKCETKEINQSPLAIRLITCRNKLKSHKQPQKYALQNALFLEPLPHGNVSEKTNTCTRIVQQHYVCANLYKSIKSITNTSDIPGMAQVSKARTRSAL